MNYKNTITYKIKIKDFFIGRLDIGKYTFLHNMNFPRFYTTEFDVFTCVNDMPLKVTQLFGKLQDEPNYLELGCPESVTLTLKPNSYVEIVIYGCEKVTNLQSRKKWLQERHLVLVKELNKTLDQNGTMSSELLKECEWITGELLKEFEKE